MDEYCECGKTARVTTIRSRMRQQNRISTSVEWLTEDKYRKYSFKDKGSSVGQDKSGKSARTWWLRSWPDPFLRNFPRVAVWKLATQRHSSSSRRESLSADTGSPWRFGRTSRITRWVSLPSHWPLTVRRVAWSSLCPRRGWKHCCVVAREVHGSVFVGHPLSDTHLPFSTLCSSSPVILGMVRMNERINLYGGCKQYFCDIHKERKVIRSLN